jgi:hypothetical protein
MAVIPIPALGKQVTAYSVTGQTVGADGTLTDATTTGVQPVLGTWEEIDITMEPETEEISASDASRQHTVVLKEAMRLRATEILQKQKPAGAGANDKAQAWQWIASAYDVLKMTLTQGGDTYVMYFVRGSYERQTRKGKQLGTFTGMPCDPGAVNPTLTAA